MDLTSQPKGDSASETGTNACPIPSEADVYFTDLPERDRWQLLDGTYAAIRHLFLPPRSIWIQSLWLVAVRFGLGIAVPLILSAFLLEVARPPRRVPPWSTTSPPAVVQTAPTTSGRAAPLDGKSAALDSYQLQVRIDEITSEYQSYAMVRHTRPPWILVTERIFSIS